MSRSDDPEPPARPRARVLVDTNGWLLPGRYGLDLARSVDEALGPSELRAPSIALRELDRLVARGVAGASVARALAARVPVEACPGRGDAGIARAAARRGAWVLTGDRAFAERLLAAGVPVLAPRRGGRLVARRPTPRPAARATVMKRPPVRKPRGARVARR